MLSLGILFAIFGTDNLSRILTCHGLLRLISISINLSSDMFRDTEPKLEFIELLFNSHFKPLWFSVNYYFIYKKWWILIFNFLFDLIIIYGF